MKYLFVIYVQEYTINDMNIVYQYHNLIYRRRMSYKLGNDQVDEQS